MLLTDWQIRKLCVRAEDGTLHYVGGNGLGYRRVEAPMIEPFSESVSGNGIVSYGLTHAGYDLRLGGEILVFKNTYGEIIDPRHFQDPAYRSRIFDRQSLAPGESLVLPSHSYVLGHSLEYLRIPAGIKGRCVGKSTLARMGVLINTTPAEPLWHGHLTLEIGNVTPAPVRLRIGEGIAQMEFETLAQIPETNYESKGGQYQGQTGVTPPRVRT